MSDLDIIREWEKMSNEEKNIKIAEFCGYKKDRLNVGKHGEKMDGYWFEGLFRTGDCIPNYVKDSKAVETFTSFLRKDKVNKFNIYIAILMRLCDFSIVNLYCATPEVKSLAFYVTMRPDGEE
jgi:hypothetical protein